jgi:hypothetical protein
MGKKSRRKQKRREARIRQIAQAEIQAAEKPKKRIGIVGWSGIIAAIVAIFLVPAYWEPLKRTFMSKKQRNEYDNFDTGTLKPAPLDTSLVKSETAQQTFLDTSGKTPHVSTNVVEPPEGPPIKGILIFDSVKTVLLFQWGTNNFGFTMKQLEDGVTIDRMVHVCGPVDVKFKVKDNRIYTSAKFNSILNEENIGTMEYNHWRVYLPNLMDYDHDEERLQVRDKQSNIVFSIQYLGNGRVSIAGYFVDEDKIFVLVNDPTVQTPFICVPKKDPEWRSKAAAKIKQIKPIFY